MKKFSAGMENSRIISLTTVVVIRGFNPGYAYCRGFLGLCSLVALRVLYGTAGGSNKLEYNSADNKLAIR